MHGCVRAVAANGTSGQPDAAGQGIVLDRHGRPDTAEEFVLMNDAMPMPDEIEEDVIHARLQHNGLAHAT